jgi:hypothetical protein
MSLEKTNYLGCLSVIACMVSSMISWLLNLSRSIFFFLDWSEPSPLVLRPFVGLLYQPWIMPAQCCSSQHKSHTWLARVSNLGPCNRKLVSVWAMTQARVSSYKTVIYHLCKLSWQHFWNMVLWLEISVYTFSIIVFLHIFAVLWYSNMDQFNSVHGSVVVVHLIGQQGFQISTPWILFNRVDEKPSLWNKGEYIRWITCLHFDCRACIKDFTID